MISIGKIARAEGAGGAERLAATLQRYFSDAALGLQANPRGDDYWRRGAEAPGWWAGRGAPALGLTGTIERADFERLLAGEDPRSGEQLGRIFARSKVAAFDVTFSAPKGVSLLWALSDDPQVQAAVEQSVRDGAMAAAAYLDRRAGFGRRWSRSLGKPEVVRAQMVHAAFLHRTARPVTDPTTGAVTVDPQLHVHLVTPSLVRRTDGQWSQLLSEPLYAHAAAAGGLGQAAMRESLRRSLGVALEVEANGCSRVTELPGELEAEFSRRTRQSAEMARNEEVSSLMGAKRAIMSSREKKRSVPDVLGQIRARAAQLGWTPARVHAFLSARPEPILETEPTALFRRLGWSVERAAAFQDHHRNTPAEQVPLFAALDTLTDQSLVFSRRELLRQLAGCMPASTPASELERIADRILEDEELTRPVRPRPNAAPAVAPELAEPDPWIERGLEQRWTTPEALLVERRMLRTALERQEAQPVQVPSALVKRAIAEWEERTGRTLTLGQQALVRELTVGRAGVVVIEGRAGTGKTAAVEVAHAALRQAGVPIVGAAVAGRAAIQLQEDSGIRSFTLHGLLSTVRERGVPRGSVIVLDEAGMAGSRQVAALVQATAAADARLVLIGDRAQLQPIDGGAPFRALGNYLGKLELTEVLRQRQDWQREALSALRRGEGQEAWSKFREHGAVRLAETAGERRQLMLADWHQAVRENPDVLMLTYRREDVASLNALAHATLKLEARLGPEMIPVAGDQHQVGEMVVAGAGVPGSEVRNGTRGEIVQLSGEKITIREASGKEHSWDHREHDARLELGWALTVHRAQGVTCHTALYAGDPGSWAELNYTALSRNTHAVAFYAVAQPPEEDPLGVHHAPQMATQLDDWELRHQAGWRRFQRQESTLDYEIGRDPAQAAESALLTVASAPQRGPETAQEPREELDASLNTSVPSASAGTAEARTAARLARVGRPDGTPAVTPRPQREVDREREPD